jgi:hypothetical protein
MRPISLIFAGCLAAGVYAEISGLGTTIPFIPLHQEDSYAHYVSNFNQLDPGTNSAPASNGELSNWLNRNVPQFYCPDRTVEELYYFRWLSFRKHLKQTPKGWVITEFLPPVSHAGEFNTISCAAGFHLAEGRWLRDRKYLDDYIQFWLRSNRGKPPEHFHKFSSWFAAAVWERHLVEPDKKFITRLLPDLVADYRAWELERRATNGLFWQFDVRDGMEESISGSRTQKNLRPTINAYMFANAQAIAAIATLASRPKLATEFTEKADTLRRLTQENLWDDSAKFFKVRLENGMLSSAREAIGFVPWMFSLPDNDPKYAAAWGQLTDPQGFAAPYGITTAERRHPEFRSRGVGTCEWDGAVWPFATSQTLYALANLLRDYQQDVVTRRDYFQNFLTYASSQHAHSKPYIGEYLDEVTGDWINRGDRSRFYNHSTFADLLITGLIGLRPRADDVVEVHPLLPTNAWDWFCLYPVKYHGHELTIIWDKDGSRYNCGMGFQILSGNKVVARSDQLTRISGKLP